MEGLGEMEEGWRKGPWTAEEDRLLIEYVNLHGGGRWNSVSTLTGLRRNGKSCRLRWVNYLRPDLKRGQITPDEEKIILELHARWGNRWSTIARSLPGRTDNEIKNYWRTHFKKKEKVLSNNPKKSKTLYMRRQQYQQQQQQQQQQLNQVDAQRILYLLDGSISQTKEEMATVNPSIVPDDQGLFYSVMCSNTSTPDAAHEDDFLWDGLWNLDDHIPGNLSAICATSRASMHNFGAPFY